MDELGYRSFSKSNHSQYGLYKSMFESATPTVQPAPPFPHGVSGNPVGRKAHLERLMNKGQSKCFAFDWIPANPMRE